MAGTFGWILYPIVASRWILPFDIWYPMNVVSVGGYTLAYLFQIFGQTYVGLGKTVLVEKVCLIAGNF